MTLDGVPLIGLSAPVILGFGVLLLFRGLLIPRRTYDDMRVFLTKDRDDWREAHTVSERAREIQDRQIQELLEQSRTTLTVVRSIASAANASKDS